MKYSLITSPNDLDSCITYLGESPILALDTETSSLNPHNGLLRLIQFKTAKDEIFIIDLFKFNAQEVGQKLKPILEDKERKLCIQNSSFEYKWLYHHLGIKLQTVFDTYLASVLCDFQSEHNLGYLIQQYLDINIDKSEGKSDWSGELSKSQLLYAANDVEYLMPLREKLITKLRETSQIKAMRLEMDIVPAVALMEFHGMPCRKDKYDVLIRSLEQERDEKYKKLDEWFKTDGGKKNAYESLTQNDLFGNTLQVKTEQDVNIRSQKQLIKKFQELGIDLESTDKKYLNNLKRQHPELNLLLDFRGIEKLCSTYGQNFIDEFLNKITNRIHPSIRQIGTVTKRFAESDPNLQNQPSEERFRAVYGLPDDSENAMIIADVAGFELRILAHLSKDPAMMEAFNSGKDLHSIAAVNLFKIPYDEAKTTYKKQRLAAKVGNFSIVYDISPESLATRMKMQGVEEASEDFAKKVIEGFYKSFPVAGNWLKAQEQAVLKNPEIRTIAGHIMKIDLDPNDKKSVGMAKRAARNYRIQSYNSVCLKRAIKLLFDRLEKFPEAKILNAVHDELILEAPKKDAEEIRTLLQRTMIEAAEEYIQDVKIEVEAVVGSNWADKK